MAVDRCRNKDGRVQFYHLDPTLENIARNLLLFSIVFESPALLGYHTKVELFLEIFGDLKIREQTRQFLQKKTEDLIRLVTGDKHGKEEFCVFDLSHLRYKDKDELEKIFKRWINVKKDERDYAKSWEARSRRDLEARYDHRVGAYDWDYAMNLSDVGVRKSKYPCSGAPGQAP
ncbi:hypothetical protein RvY_13283 [Ramazzottius varieornatus]|uniref:Uncharacterized protein n=1 Tax=Ramazzottius varieornatus TaxID=947166 RepID=A0A1D1VMD8_RAMVA|nr:hypothetical protein RvY_13283 [Ramazzottius varieornatus]